MLSKTCFLPKHVPGRKFHSSAPAKIDGWRIMSLNQRRRMVV